MGTLHVTKNDLVGKRFGRLVAQKIEKTYKGMTFWVCICDCGVTTTVFRSALLQGKTKSCGCLQKEVYGKASITHGLYASAAYKRWLGMMKRCYKPKTKSFKNYGGRGITVSAEWHDFAKFYKDFGQFFRCGYSVDRIDNDGPYSKENCRWATSKEQNRNTRRNLWITLNGVKKLFIDCVELYKIPHKTAWSRQRIGWKPEEIFGLVKRKRRGRP